MDVQLDLVTIHVAVQPAIIVNPTTTHFSFRIDTRASFRLDPYYDPQLITYRQQVRTQFRKTRVGSPPEVVDTLWHDDGYGVGDGVWDDGGRIFWVNDTPGIDMCFGEQLTYYQFDFQQTFKKSFLPHDVLLQTPVFQLQMMGTYQNIQTAIDPQIVNGCWEARRVVDIGNDFQLDADF